MTAPDLDALTARRGALEDRCRELAEEFESLNLLLLAYNCVLDDLETQELVTDGEPSRSLTPGEDAQPAEPEPETDEEEVGGGPPTEPPEPPETLTAEAVRKWVEGAGRWVVCSEVAEGLAADAVTTSVRLSYLASRDETGIVRRPASNGSNSKYEYAWVGILSEKARAAIDAAGKGES